MYIHTHIHTHIQSLSMTISLSHSLSIHRTHARRKFEGRVQAGTVNHRKPRQLVPGEDGEASTDEDVELLKSPSPKKKQKNSIEKAPAPAEEAPKAPAAAEEVGEELFAEVDADGYVFQYNYIILYSSSYVV